MDMSSAVKSALSQYVTFSGRAPRSEFWYFALFCLIVTVVANIIDIFLFGVSIGGNQFSPIATIVAILIFLPSIAVSVRRLHDIDRTGWWWWINLVPIVGIIVFIVFACTRGTQGANRYGNAIV